MQSNLTFLQTANKHFERLPIKSLNIDSSYQKPLSNPHVKKITSNFDPIGVGQIHVNRRSDGTLWIFDGQHRVAAYRELGIKEIECIVYSGLSHEEEVKGYRWYNTTMKEKPLNAFKVELEQGVPSSVDINSIAESQGLGIDYMQDRSQPIQAIVSLKSVYKSSGRDALIDVLDILKRSFGPRSSSFQAFMINGLNSFLLEYSDEPSFDRAWLIKNLTRHGYKQFRMDASAMKTAYNVTLTESSKIAYLKIYNYNKRKENKL